MGEREIIVEARYTPEMLKDFIVFFPNRGRAYKLLKWLPLIGLVLFGAASAVFFMLNNPALGVLFAAIATFAIAVLAFRAITLREFTKSLIKTPVKQKYLFSEDRFAVCKQEGRAVIAEHKYEELYKAYETSNAYYVAQSKRDAYIVPKGGFIEGTPQDLSEMLRDKLGNRFVMCE